LNRVDGCFSYPNFLGFDQIQKLGEFLKNLKISFPKPDFGLFPACPETNPLMHFPEML